MRYLLLCCLILGLLAGNCEAVACQRIQEECVLKTVIFDIREEAVDIEITVVTTDWDGEVREKTITYTVDPDDAAIQLEITKSVSIQNVKWFIREADSTTKASRRPAARRYSVPEVPDMECQCGSWGTLKVYRHGELVEVRP